MHKYLKYLSEELKIVFHALWSSKLGKTILSYKEQLAQRYTTKRGMPTDILHIVCMLWSHDSVNRLVDNLTSQQPAFQLLPQQAPLSSGSLHEATVLLSTAGQIRDYFVDGAVRNVLVDWKACLACFQIREGDSVSTVSTVCGFSVMTL